MKKTFLTVIAAVASCQLASASVTIQYQIGELTGLGGSDILNSIGIIVADNNANGFDFANTLNGATLTAGSFIDGDEILEVFTIADIGGPQGGAGTISALDYDGGLAEGTQLGILWFDGIESIGATVTAGINFGEFSGRAANPNSGGDMGTALKADPGAYTMAFFDNTTTTGASGLDDSLFEASQTVVPEPSGVVLLGLGAVAGIFRRRRS